jgi:glycosyltransferase involved in cell wall biosynthesis
MWRLASAALVYTVREAEDMRQLGSNVPTFVAANAVGRRQHSHVAAGSRRHLLQIGRLVGPKRPMLLLRAFSIVLSRLDEDVELWFVGEGPGQSDLKRVARELGIETRVRFLGAVTQPTELSRVFDSCLVSCSPGYAGLSVTQSFAYGVPCIIADSEPHAPEIALASDANSRLFASGSAESLAAAIADVYRHQREWIAAAPAISDECLRSYSVEAMADGFVAALRHVEPETMPPRG